MKNLSFAPLRLGGLVAFTALLVGCAATTNAISTKQPPRYNSQECKLMHGRGVINLDQYKKCIHQQPFGNMAGEVKI